MSCSVSSSRSPIELTDDNTAFNYTDNSTSFSDSWNGDGSTVVYNDKNLIRNVTSEYTINVNNPTTFYNLYVGVYIKIAASTNGWISKYSLSANVKTYVDDVLYNTYNYPVTTYTEYSSNNKNSVMDEKRIFDNIACNDSIRFVHTLDAQVGINPRGSTSTNDSVSYTIRSTTIHYDKKVSYS